VPDEYAVLVSSIKTNRKGVCIHDDEFFVEAANWEDAEAKANDAARRRWAKPDGQPYSGGVLCNAYYNRTKQEHRYA
jgi:hypothetical protein